jgi:hypothetical protein
MVSKMYLDRREEKQVVHRNGLFYFVSLKLLTGKFLEILRYNAGEKLRCVLFPSRPEERKDKWIRHMILWY